MLYLAAVPSVPQDARVAEAREPASYHVMRSAMIGITVAVVFSLGMIAIAVFGFAAYDTPLFIGLPVAFGAALGYVFNRDAVRNPGATNQAVLVGLGILGGLIFLFELEGIVCLMMALPIAIPLAILGGQVGRKLAIMNRGSIAGAMAALMLVPGGLLVNKIGTPVAPTYEIVTAIDIAAPPAAVWKNVIGFREIHAP